MNEALLACVLRAPHVPSLPRVAVDVLKLARHAEADLRGLALLIQSDAAFATRVLRSANSTFYGQAEPVSTLGQALVVLGIRGLRTLALGFALSSLSRQLHAGQRSAVDLALLWRRSITAAIAARHIALRVGGIDGEELFLSALAHDLGVVALAQSIGEPYTALLRQVGAGRELVSAERKRLDLDHAQVGAALAENWRLPPVLVEPIRWHEAPEQAPAEHRRHVLAVGLAVGAADLLQQPAAAQGEHAFHAHARSWFGLSPAQVQSILERTRVMAQGASLLAVAELTGEDLPQLLASASEALTELSLQTCRAVDEGNQRYRTLQERAQRDPLTGVSARPAFLQALDQQFALARQGQSLSLLLVCLDAVQHLTESAGHRGCDLVIASLAELVKEQAPNLESVGRLRSEEFIVMLPGLGWRRAVTVAEMLRRRAQAANVELGAGARARFTVSAGVAAHEVAAPVVSATELLRLADAALAAAKEAGGNCVGTPARAPVTVG